MLQASSITRRNYYLRLSVTDRCNFRCAYCRPAEAAAERTPPAAATEGELIELVRHIDHSCPLKKLRLTGGEPLVRFGLSQIVHSLRALLPEVDLALTTNGSLLRRLAGPLRDAGLDAINVSLDTVDPGAFAKLTRGGRLDSAIAGILTAQAVGFTRLKVNTVLIRRVNGNQLGTMVRWAAGQGCEIRFIELMPCGPGAELFATDYLSTDDAIERLKEDHEYLGEIGRDGTARRHRFAVDGRVATVGMISPVSHPFCGDCNRLRLDCHGRLAACLRKQHHVDLLALLRRGEEQTLSERIASCVASKGSPGESWPARQMVLIGG